MCYYIFRKAKGESDEIPQWTYVTACEEIEQTEPYMTPDEQHVYGVFEYRPEGLAIS